MTSYINLQGCLKVEMKQLMPIGVEQKSNSKTPITKSGYTKEFKDQLIEVYNSGVYETIAECARNYQVPERLLYQWLSSSKNQSKPGEQSFELSKLKKENAQLKMENEILKKATVYFAKQMK
jgi:transposase